MTITTTTTTTLLPPEPQPLDTAPGITTEYVLFLRLHADQILEQVRAFPMDAFGRTKTLLTGERLEWQHRYDHLTNHSKDTVRVTDSKTGKYLMTFD